MAKTQLMIVRIALMNLFLFFCHDAITNLIYCQYISFYNNYGWFHQFYIINVSLLIMEYFTLWKQLNIAA